MFAGDIKRHINDANASAAGTVNGASHQRGSSQPNAKTNTIKIASMAQSGKTTAVAGGAESAV